MNKGLIPAQIEMESGEFLPPVALVLWLRHLCPGGQFCRSITNKCCTSCFAQTWLQQLVVGGTVVKNLPANPGDVGDLGLIPGLGRSPGVWNSNPLPGGSDGKKSAFKAGHLCSIPGLGKSPGEGNGNPLQYSFLGNSMVRGAWWTTVHGVTKSPTWLNDQENSWWAALW